MLVNKVKAYIIYNSRGQKTVEVVVNNGKGSVPSGASTSSKEVPLFPENNPELAVSRFNDFFVDKITGREFYGFEDLKEIESLFFELGGYEFFGGAVLLALEFALLDALSKYLEEPLFNYLLTLCHYLNFSLVHWHWWVCVHVCMCVREDLLQSFDRLGYPCP